MRRADARLRVVFVEFQPLGGLTHHAWQLADAVARRGHHVRLLTARNSELAGRPGAARVDARLAAFDPHRRLARGRWTRHAQRMARGAAFARAWWQVARVVRRDRPDVVHLSELRTVLDGLGVEWLARRRPRTTALVDTCHNAVPFDRRSGAGALRSGPALRAALGRAYRRMDAVVVHGSDARRRFRAAWPGAGPVEIVPQGEASLFGTPLPPPAGPPTVLFFGSWAGYKGLDVLLDAFGLVHERMPDARMEIAGATTREVPEEWVITRCAEFDGAATAIPRYVSVAEARELFGRATVVALPYREGFQSAVANTALTLGRPVVCTRVGDIAVAVEASGAGIVVPPGDPTAFAEALVAVLGDPAGATRMGERGPRWMAEASSWDLAAERLEPLYRRIAAARVG